jgi:FlaG/FlaF family flagellin (archaellin)
VIATILMVAITVVLAAVLYVMVSGLIAVTPPAKTMGVTVSRSADGANWTLVIVSVPVGIGVSATRLSILNPGGAVALAAQAFDSLAYAPDGVEYIGDGDGTIEASERLLISTSMYPTGYRVEISDNAGILFAGNLQ